MPPLLERKHIRGSIWGWRRGPTAPGCNRCAARGIMVAQALRGRMRQHCLRIRAAAGRAQSGTPLVQRGRRRRRLCLLQVGRHVAAPQHSAAARHLRGAPSLLPLFGLSGLWGRGPVSQLHSVFKYGKTSSVLHCAARLLVHWKMLTADTRLRWLTPSSNARQRLVLLEHPSCIS